MSEHEWAVSKKCPCARLEAESGSGHSHAPSSLGLSFPQAPASLDSSENSPARSPPAEGPFGARAGLGLGEGLPQDLLGSVEAPRADRRFLDAPRGAGPSCPALLTQQHGCHWRRAGAGAGISGSRPPRDQASALPAAPPPQLRRRGQGQPILPTRKRGLTEAVTGAQSTAQGRELPPTRPPQPVKSALKTFFWGGGRFAKFYP